ncbi:MAG: NADH dehydrogenase [Bacteroidetes bacterium]|nr:MAG: NADH dehydrogenase [Bacteroidota bacterium]
MRIIILGANGQLGREIYSMLDQKMPGAEIIAAVRKKHLHFEGCTGDRQHRSVVFDLFADDFGKLGKADLLINCIGSITGKTENDFRKIHVGVTQLILRHREKLGNPRIIQLSALGADKNSESLFMRSKAEADELLLQHKDVLVIRPSIVCTPGTRIIKKTETLKKIAVLFFNCIPFPAGALETEIQPVLARDLAELVWRCAENMPEEKIIEATGPEIITLRSLLKTAIPAARIIPVNQRFCDGFYAIAAPLIRRWMSEEEWLLLRGKNTGTNRAMEKTLGRKPGSTDAFWQEELLPDPAKKKNRIIRQSYAFDVS